MNAIGRLLDRFLQGWMLLIIALACFAVAMVFIVQKVQEIGDTIGGVSFDTNTRIIATDEEETPCLVFGDTDFMGRQTPDTDQSC